MRDRLPTKILNPTLKKLTRKREFVIEFTESVTTHGTEWSGGSRSSYSSVTPRGGPLMPHDNDQYPEGWPSCKPGLKIVEPGRIVVETGTFCGKPATLVVHCHPDDLHLVAPAITESQKLGMTQIDL